MKKLLFAITLWLIGYSSFAQSSYKDTTQYYSFQINYWFNLHHFLWLESFMNVNVDSTLINQELPPDSREKLDQALNYYRENLADLDLRTSDYMTEFKHWITTQGKELPTVPAKFQPHTDALEEVSGVYEQYYWPTHEAACKKVLEDNISLIRQTEEEFVDGIKKLTRQFWQFEKLKVDISYYGKVTTWNLRVRPYTSIFPTHVVMNAFGENEVKGNWVELLYHESAHHLILGSSYFVGGTITDVAETMNVKPPRQLGHSYLFYFTGELTKQLLNEAGVAYDSTYMERNSVFSAYYPSLDKYLKPYMNREITLTEATRKIIEDLG